MLNNQMVNNKLHVYDYIYIYIYGESRKGSGTPRFFPVIPLNMLTFFDMLDVFCWRSLTWPRWNQEPQLRKVSSQVLLPSGNLLRNELERSTMLLMGKSTISIAIFNSYVTNYQRVSSMAKIAGYYSYGFCSFWGETSVWVDLDKKHFSWIFGSFIGLNPICSWSLFGLDHLFLTFVASIRFVFSLFFPLLDNFWVNLGSS